MKVIFEQDIDILEDRLIVAIGVNEDELNDYLTKYYLYKGCFDLTNPSVCKINANGSYLPDILYLPSYDASWKSINTLIHELIHIKQNQFSKRKINNEIEFEAYFVTKLFDNIRNKLDEYLINNKI